MISMTGNIQRRFWKRLGLAGFTFFLVKGLIWLVRAGRDVLMGTAGL